jgi:hypothetical protein
MAYFFISVSNKTNLELCIKYALAGFTNSINGVWTFLELQEGDFVSFLYGAKVFNLYKVKYKEAIKKADKIGPWPSVTFRMSGRTYYFPFRISLTPIREFTEPMVRQEFAYIAENLLLRGGYRKTHFQADQTTLQAVSQMGEPYKNSSFIFKEKYQTFTPLFVFNRKISNPPEIFPFQEFILQSLIRHWLSQTENLKQIFIYLGLNTFSAGDFEVLGEKAFPEGHVDILIKESSPKGYCKKIIVEVKMGSLQKKDIDQLQKYMDELGEECKKGILIGKKVSKKIIEEAKNKKIQCFLYSFKNLDLEKQYAFNELLSNLQIKIC